MRLLVIVAEGAIERPLLEQARELGAISYTVADVRSGGEGGPREATWEADRSVEIKIVCPETVADRIAEHVLARYARHYWVRMFVADVGVFRPERF
ncbi:MAG: transcriptional regulator [Burkholderiales bacterium]|nr:MAG: transcriptional regulator [Burkholderiales bacterium]